MALPDYAKIDNAGTDIVLADATDHPSVAAANNLGTRTDQIDMTSLADSAYRQSAKVDMGAQRAPLYHVMAAFELAPTPTAGELIHLYFAFSNSATAGTANPAGLSGSDAAYTGYSSNADAAIKQVEQVLSCPVTVQATGNVQHLDFGYVFAPLQYLIVVVRNESGAAFHSDMVESSILFTPVESRVQDAV